MCSCVRANWRSALQELLKLPIANAALVTWDASGGRNVNGGHGISHDRRDVEHQTPTLTDLQVGTFRENLLTAAVAVT
jgi:hypothetical protein